MGRDRKPGGLGDTDSRYTPRTYGTTPLQEKFLVLLGPFVTIVKIQIFKESVSKWSKLGYAPDLGKGTSSLTVANSAAYDFCYLLLSKCHGMIRLLE